MMLKMGKKDRNGSIKIPATKWLIELDNVLQPIMVKCNYGPNHSELRNIAKEMNKDFLQFCLFSETRFHQYAHRNYNHFSNMFHILFEKLLRDASKDTRKDERDANENIQNLLVQAELVINLLFMQDFLLFSYFVLQRITKI